MPTCEITMAHDAGNDCSKLNPGFFLRKKKGPKGPNSKLKFLNAAMIQCVTGRLGFQVVTIWAKLVITITI